MYCASLKAYVHVTHVVTGHVVGALECMKAVPTKEESKVYS